eukprot:scaffold5824_cov73-Phaeocystis_antarctica.AAC.4
MTWQFVDGRQASERGASERALFPGLSEPRGVERRRGGASNRKEARSVRTLLSPRLRPEGCKTWKTGKHSKAGASKDATTRHGARENIKGRAKSNTRTCDYISII